MRYNIILLWTTLKECAILLKLLKKLNVYRILFTNNCSSCNMRIFFSSKQLFVFKAYIERKRHVPSSRSNQGKGLILNLHKCTCFNITLHFLILISKMFQSYQGINLYYFRTTYTCYQKLFIINYAFNAKCDFFLSKVGFFAYLYLKKTNAWFQKYLTYELR